MATDRTSMVISPVIATICIDAGATARADWPAARSKGALFVLADPEGYVATARIGHREQDCDDCAGPGIDLGGDRYADLALVTRCAHVLPSGCIDHVCDRTCSGVRVGTALNATPTSIVCRSFIPDVDDCVP